MWPQLRKDKKKKEQMEDQITKNQDSTTQGKDQYKYE